MAEFSNQDVGAIQNPITPRSPVVDTSSSFEGASTSAAIGGVVDAFSGIADMISKNSQNKALSSFMQQQLNIADAVDQGLISSQAGRMRMRSNFLSATSASPALTPQIVEYQKILVGTSGLGKVVAEGTEEEKAQIKLINDSRAAGFGDDEEGVNNYLKFTKSVSDLAHESKKISLEKSKNELERSVQQDKADKALAEVAATFLPGFRTSLNTIVSENPRASGTDLVNLFTDKYAESQEIAAQIIAGGGSKETVDALMKPLETIYNSFVGNANGSLTKTDLDNRIDNALARANLNLLTTNPKLRSYVAVSSLLPNSTILSEKVATELNLAIMAQLSDGSEGDVPDLVTPSKENTNVFDTVKDVIKNVTGPNPFQPEEANKELETVVENINNSVIKSDYGSSDGSFGKGAKDYKNVMSFYASSEYGKHSVLNGPAKNFQEAKEVIHKNYSDVVLPLIQKEFTGAEIFALTPRPTNDFITGGFVDGSFKFMASANPTDSSLAVRGKFRIKDEVRRLNRVVAGPLNEIIRAGAHISGHQDYQKEWLEWVAPKLGIRTEGDESVDELASLLTGEDGSTTNPKGIELEEFISDSRIDLSGDDGKATASTPVLDALIEIESGGDPDAVSSAGARGVAQIMPHTARDPGFGLPSIDLDTSTPEEQKEWAGNYLEKLTERYKGNQAFALAAYNWGIGNVDKWIKKGAKLEDLPKETRNYLKQFRDKGVLNGK